MMVVEMSKCEQARRVLPSHMHSLNQEDTRSTPLGVGMGMKRWEDSTVRTRKIGPDEPGERNTTQSQATRSDVRQFSRLSFYQLLCVP